MNGPCFTSPAPAGYSLGTYFYPASGLSGHFFGLGMTAAGQSAFRQRRHGQRHRSGIVAGTVRSAFAHAGWEAGPSRIFEACRGASTIPWPSGSYATVFHALIDPATGTAAMRTPARTELSPPFRLHD